MARIGTLPQPGCEVAGAHGEPSSRGELPRGLDAIRAAFWGFSRTLECSYEFEYSIRILVQKQRCDLSGGAPTGSRLSVVSRLHEDLVAHAAVSDAADQ